jgi:hypothetical protein
LHTLVPALMRSLRYTGAVTKLTVYAPGENPHAPLELVLRCVADSLIWG